MDTAAHLPPERLEAFLKGACTATNAAEVEAHIDACEDCRVLLSTLVRGQRDAAGDQTHQVAVAPVTEGDVVAGKYKVERIIGSGGMGSVVAAWHQQLNQRVALKFMLPAIAADPQAAARFLREARAAARLSTPHVGRVVDLDSLPNGTPYLVMEFLEGETCGQRLARVGRLSVNEALAFIRQALAALAEAHTLHIVHRDFKPANLFHAKRPDGTELLKVLDFGIAKSVDPEIERGLASTSSRMLMGSPPYMAPEQINSGNIDARTDVWAVGVVLYEMLSGRLPFEGATVVDLMFAIQNKAHKPLAEEMPLPMALAEVIDRCLAKRPERRFADAAAVAEALKDAEKSPPAPPAVKPAPPMSIRTVAAAAAGAALLLFGVGFLVVRSTGPAQDEGRHRTRGEPPLIVPPPPPRLEARHEAKLEEADDLLPVPLPPPPAVKAPVKKKTRPASKDTLFEERR